MKVEIGDKVYGNYGAMHPIVFGIVEDIDRDGVVTFFDRYDPSERYTVDIGDIQPTEVAEIANGYIFGVFA